MSNKGGKIRAVILLGGFGTRLRPFTLTTPKSFLPVANVPMIHYQLSLLARYGIDSVILSVGQHCKNYKSRLDIAKDLGIKISICCESKPLGTAGGIKNASNLLKENEPFFVFNGDIIADFNLEKMLSFHKRCGADVSIGVVEVENPKDFGVIVVDEKNKIMQFIEKPQQPVSNLINAGVYIINPEILDEIPSGREVSIEKETFPHLINSGKKLFAYLHKGYWIDIGTVEKYKKANFDVVEGRADFAKDLIAGRTKKIGKDGKLKVGKNVVFEKNVEIKGSVIIGDDCFIGENTVLADSILFKKIYVGKNCFIENSVIGNASVIEDDCKIKGLAIADKSRLCKHSKIVEC